MISSALGCPAIASPSSGVIRVWDVMRVYAIGSHARQVVMACFLTLAHFNPVHRRPMPKNAIS